MREGIEFRDEVLGDLSRSGFDTSKPHVFDFYLYLPSRQSAIGVKDVLHQQGVACEIRPAADSKNWLCLAKQTLIPDSAALNDLATLFENVSQAHGGEFDGWEAGPA